MVVVVFIFIGNVSAVYILNRVIMMVMNNDLSFLITDALGTNGGGMHLFTC